MISVGAIIPYVEPYRSEKELYKLIGVFSPMLSLYSHEKFMTWAKEAEIANRFLKVNHGCGNSDYRCM